MSAVKSRRACPKAMRRWCGSSGVGREVSSEGVPERGQWPNPRRTTACKRFIVVLQSSFTLPQESEAMPESPQDMWSQWLLHRRFGGDPQRMQAELVNFLYPIRDKVLRYANLGEGETLLDV